VRFCPWYPLRDAAAHTPASPNMLQVRLAHGLRTYPRGKSAMVHYESAVDARAAAVALAARWPAPELWCRHLLEGDGEGDGEEDGDGAEAPAESPAESPAQPGSADRSAAYCAKLAAEFLRRFGSLPTHDEPTNRNEAG
jgi:hypothetical protein